MKKLRSLVTFESQAFNVTQRHDYFINECCYGDDVARWLIEQLRSCGVQTDDEPGQEDFGWYFDFQVGDAGYQFIIGHRPGDEDDPPVWIGWLERKKSLLASILRRGHEIQPDVARMIHSVLKSAPQVSNVRWHYRKAFDTGREENGREEPAAE